jgi:hypothetical protein
MALLADNCEGDRPRRVPDVAGEATGSLLVRASEVHPLLLANGEYPHYFASNADSASGSTGFVK